MPANSRRPTASRPSRFEYIFTDTPDANWTDRLVLVTEDGRLRIDDVLFGTRTAGDGLRSALVELFDN